MFLGEVEPRRCKILMDNRQGRLHMGFLDSPNADEQVNEYMGTYRLLLQSLCLRRVLMTSLVGS